MNGIFAMTSFVRLAILKIQAFIKIILQIQLAVFSYSHFKSFLELLT